MAWRILADQEPWRTGTRIKKVNSRTFDKHKDGELGWVVVHFRAKCDKPPHRYIYCVMWASDRKCGFVHSSKVIAGFSIGGD